MTSNTPRTSIKSGFTLIETLMAIFILTLAIAGPLTIASKGLGAALTAKEQTTAFYLAQDAIEFIRYQRDTNRLAGQPWLTGLTTCLTSVSPTGCTVLSISHTITACGATCAALNFDGASTFQYTYAAGAGIVTTPFVRKVTIVNPACDTSGVLCNTDDARVVVDVSWHDVGKVTHGITVQENMLNWQ